MKIPQEVVDVITRLKQAGFEAYAVGGCVRDIVLSKVEGLSIKPQDWDVTTSAKPEEIIKLFPDSFYENAFLTVTVKTGSKDATLKEIEVTTFRAEGRYSDKRHPDEVRFAKTLEEDLSRRDFTMNAIAISLQSAERKAVNSDSRFAIGELQIIDPFSGQEDIKKKFIRTVGEPDERFNEDALRMLRAVRLAVQLDFEIESKTLVAIQKSAKLLDMIAKERVRDELAKIIMSEKAQDGIFLLKDTGLLHYIIPELEQGIGCEQNHHHIYTVFDHNVYSLGFAAKFGYNLETRLGALLHDVGKPATKRGVSPAATFYGHEVVGAKMTKKILERLKFPHEIVEKVTTLVRYHLFYYNVGEVTMSSVRRVVVKVGPQNIKDLVHVRMSERLGSGVPKAKPYKLRHFEFMVEKALHDPLSVKMLKVDGNDIMQELAIEPGPKVGYVLNALMNEVLDEPKKNEQDYLMKRIKELGALPDSDLQKLGQEGKVKIGEGEEKWEDETKRKHYVQ